MQIQIDIPIANQCPYAGGPSVYIARGLLRIVNDSIDYFDDVICLQSGYYREMNVVSNIEPVIKLIPNPTNNFVDVFSSIVNVCMDAIELYNNLGELVFSGTTEIGVLLKWIDVTGFAPGIYSLKVKQENNFHLEKLVIIK